MNSILQSWCDSEPNIDDLKSRNEYFIEKKERMIMIEKAFLEGCEIYSDFTFRPVRPSIFHEWSGTEWIDSRTEEERLSYKRSQYPILNRYQFKRCLLENGIKSEDIELKILSIDDEIIRELTLLGFQESDNFKRLDQTVLELQKLFDATDETVDKLWEYALTL